MDNILNKEIVFFNISGISVFISFWIYAISFTNKFNILKKLGTFTLATSLITLTIALVLRGLALKFFPLSNLYESLLMLGWAMTFMYLILEYKMKINSFGWVVSGLLLIIYLYASWLPASQKEIMPLVPALQSYWRIIHVPPLIMSYAVFIIASISSTAYLIEVNFIKQKPASSTTEDSKIKINIQGNNISERAKFFDEVTYRCIGIGFPLLTIGIINGGLWANHAWGAFWQWDPKETMALVTLFVYAIYLHFRLNVQASGKVLASISLIGVVMVYLTYLGVNLYDFGGLHTYGKLG